MSRLIIVSNRLPVTVHARDGRAVVRPSAGGLATGLRGPEVFVMLLLGVATLAAMRRGAVIARGEGALLLAVYLGYTVWLWHALS